jgi:hypothetical protein
MHNGLEELFEKGKRQGAGIIGVPRTRRPDVIDTAKTFEALNTSGFDFHPLHGKPTLQYPYI